MNKVLVQVNIPYAVEVTVTDEDLYRADDFAEEQVMSDERVYSLILSGDVGADEISSKILQSIKEKD